MSIYILTGENSKAVDVDKVWNFLGHFGKYQLFQLCIVVLMASTLSVPVLSGLFVGAQVKFHCATNLTIDVPPNASIEVSSCSVKVKDNLTSQILDTLPCSSYEYEGDGTTLSYVEQWHLVCDRDVLGQLPQTMTMAGMLIGALTLPTLGDRYGRKRLCLTSLLGLLLVSFTMAFVEHFELFLLLKLFTGVLEQGATVPCAVLILELIPTERRSLCGLFGATHWTLSVLFLTLTAYSTRNYDWRLKQMAYACFFLAVFVGICFLDESVRWLMGNGRAAEAEKILKKACRLNKKDYGSLLATITESTTDHKNQIVKEQLLPTVDEASTPEGGTISPSPSSSSHNILALAKNRHMRKITFTMCYTWMVCSLTYYGLLLLSTSLAGNVYVNFLIFSTVDLPAGSAIYLSFKKFGRKKSTISFLVISAIALISSVLVACLAPKTHNYSILQTVLIMGGMFFAAGAFNACWTYTPELYPTNYRNIGAGISSATARFGAMFTPFFLYTGQTCLVGSRHNLQPRLFHQRISVNLDARDGMARATQDAGRRGQLDTH